MSDQPTVPLDIIECIIDIIAFDDPGNSSLKACSLTCRALLHPCRKHIFANVALDTQDISFKPSPPSSRLFRKLLATAPEIANYVRKLGLGVLIEPPMPEDDEANLELADMLKKFTRIQRLKLDPRTMHGILVVHYDWNNVPLCVQRALFHIFDLPTMDSLRLSCFENFPLGQLSRCIHLRRIHVEFLWTPVVDFEDLPTTLCPRSITPEEYSMGSKGLFATSKFLTSKLSTGQTFFDFRNLKKLSASWGWVQDIKATDALLKQTKQLRYLEVSVCHNLEVSGLCEMVSPSLKWLRRIVLCRIMGLQNVPSTDPLAGLPAELEKIGHRPNVLEEIEIHVHLPNDATCTTGDEWGSLDDALRYSRLPSLKTVSIRVTGKLASHSKDFADRLRVLPQKQLPALTSGKVATFSFSTATQPNSKNCEWSILNLR